MTPNALYALGVLATWLGWGFVFATGLVAIRTLLKPVGEARAHESSRLIAFAALGGLSLLFASQVPLKDDQRLLGVHGIYLPLMWPVMPFSAWGLVISLTFVVWRLVQSRMALGKAEANARLTASGFWLLAALVFGYFALKGGEDIKVLRGSLPLSFTALAALAALLVAAIASMILATRNAKARNISLTLVKHAILLLGSFIFGLPFLWLLITSFKEDRDMASPNGLVWIPKVQQTVPYLDPKHPLYESKYQGQKVQGTVKKDTGGQQVLFEITRPGLLRGFTFDAERGSLKAIPKDAPIVTGSYMGQVFKGKVIEEQNDGKRLVSFIEPAAISGKEVSFKPAELEPIREVGLRLQNYPEALEYLPAETNGGMAYLKNTLILVVMSVLGTLISSAIVAYAFSRLRFPGKNLLFTILLSTMMLPGAVTLLPTFLIFRWLGWIDTLYPLWVPAFFASAFNVFLLRQFFSGIPMELEDAAKIDGCSYLKTFWSVMLPQIKPALAVIAIWTFMGAWNNFMGPLIYISSPENMTISYALQLFNTDRNGEPGLLMAFATMSMLPVLSLFFFAQKYFIEGVTLSGLGGR